jgi:hypothetical protein
MQGQPYGYQYAPPPPPPPPPKSGLSPAVIAAIAVAGVFALLIGVPLVIGVVMGVRSALEKAADGGTSSNVDPNTVLLDQSYTTPNNLLTAHYPAHLAAKTLDDATLILSRNFGGGEDEVVTLAAVKSPITNDPKELARILLGLVDKNVAGKGGTSTQTSNRPAKCLGKYPGVEVEGTFTIPPTGAYVSKACFFIANDRGYELRYDVPRSRAAAEVPLLERIMAATELAP